MNPVKHIFQHASSYGARSSIISPWIWMIGTLLAALSTSAILGAATWVLIFFSVLTTIVLISAMVAYFFCLFKGQTDALRSENFNLEKMALEKQISSDSLTGIQPPQTNQLRDVTQVESVQDEQA